MRKDASAAFAYLEMIIRADELVALRKLAVDPDFVPIRDAPAFQEFLAKLPA